MPDMSHLDQCYFVDHETYNCPFCNRRNVEYCFTDRSTFDWAPEKPCYAYVAECSSCNGKSLHLSYERLSQWFLQGNRFRCPAPEGKSLDEVFFYSHPTSFFAMDKRIPEVIRELISEAESCLKMNLLTGASACARKAIYELLLHEKVWDLAPDYAGRIKQLKLKHDKVEPDLFDTLGHIQGLTSDLVHEASWEKWNPPTVKFVLETLRAILHELYVIPAEKKDRHDKVMRLKEALGKDKKSAGKSGDAAGKS